MTTDNVIAPRSRKQEMFISDLKDVDIVVFGGGRNPSAAYKPC